MKKLNKKTLKLISATSMVIFTLFATFSSAYAWFISIRNQDNNQEDFYVKRLDTPVSSISIHSFYGQTIDGSSFTFNPVGTDVFTNGVFNPNAPVVELHEYSLENPDHPVLILFKSEETIGLETQINLVTDFAYLGSNDNYITAKIKDKATLNGLSNKVDGGYYQVTSDESQTGTLENKITLYKYSSGSLSLVTYVSFASLKSSVSLDAANDGNYYRVHADEVHGGVSTVYQYNHTKRDFEMVWCDLGDAEKSQTNPLSSAVQFHYFKFEDELEDMVSQQNVNVETFSEATETYSYTPTNNLNCISIPKSGFTDANKSSFTKFTSDEEYNYSKDLNVFNGEITGVKYIGIVVNYDQLAIEYVFSRNLGHDALNAGLDFKCDWITEF